MFERFTTQARSVVTLAQQEARKLGRPNIGTQHVLLGILSTPDTAGARGDRDR
ncbi:MAG TPA: Clp protease N-terminal domain-containing protein [Actinomycetota bacterium]|nr:Clp protease N-terminal domain-containing protein [Actinomycetota bacterium]